MGFWQRQAEKGEARAMSALYDVVSATAPAVRPVAVLVPCHIIQEWHNGIGVTTAAGSAGIYRCQGHLWSVPLSDTEMLLLATGTPQTDPAAAFATVTRSRQDLGNLTSAARTLGMDLATTPEKFVVGGVEPHHHAAQQWLTEWVDRSQAPGNAKVARESNSNDDGDPLEYVDWDLFADELAAQTAAATDTPPTPPRYDPEAALLASFGVTREFQRADVDAPLVQTFNGSDTIIGYDLFGDSIELRLDDAVNEWALILHRDDDEGTGAVQARRWVTGAAARNSQAEVAAAVSHTLRDQAARNDRDTQFAVLVAQSTWGAVVGDLPLTLDAWRVIASDHEERFGHANFSAVHQRHVDLNHGSDRDQMELDELFGKLPDAVDTSD